MAWLLPLMTDFDLPMGHTVYQHAEGTHNDDYDKVTGDDTHVHVDQEKST